MTVEQARIQIIIVAYRTTADLLECLAALDQQSVDRFDVIICENGGDESFAAMTAALPTHLSKGQEIACISDPGNPGYAGGINRCLAERPNADLYWLLNPDTAPDKLALEQLLQRYDEGDCDAVGGVVHLPSGQILSCGGNWDRVLAYSRSMGNGMPLAERPSRDEVEPKLSFISGACILFSHKFLTTVGPMRNDYFLYGEEVEWCLRAKLRGMRLAYAPDALIEHKQGSSTGSIESINSRGKLPVYFDERNRVLTVRDVFPSDLLVAIPGSFLTLVGRYVLRGAWRQFGYALAGWWAGVRGFRGKPDWFKKIEQ